MRASRTGYLLLLVCLLALVLSPGPGSGSAYAGETIEIAHIVPFTGDLSFIGQPFHNAAMLAIEHVNEAGGVLGREVEILAEDSATDPKAAIDALEKLIKIHGVQAVVGGVPSIEAMASIEKLKLNRVVMLSPSATSPALSDVDDDDFFFRTCPSDALQGAALAKLAWDRGHRTANLISRTDDYGLGLEQVFVETFEEMGGEIGATVRYDSKAPDLSGYVVEVSREPADVIIVNALMEDGTRLFRKMAHRGVTEEYSFLVSEGVQDPGIPQEVGAEIMAGVGGATPYPEGVGTFPGDYREKFGEDPVAYCANVYDNFILLSLAIERAGEYDGTAIRDNLRDVANPPGEEVQSVAEALELLREGVEISYRGAGGEIIFDDNGDVQVSTARIWEYDQQGEIVIIDEIEVF